MKKLKLFILSLVLLASTTGCIKQDAYDNIDIYSTVYPIEYIIDYLYGEHANIKSIYPNGADINNYTISNKKLNDFSKTDMFIYNGLNSEKEVAVNLINKNNKIDIIDVTQGLEIKNHVTELWLSPKNFLMMTSNVKNNLKSYISNSTLKDTIDTKYDDLKIKLSELDAELQLVADNTANKRLIVVDKAFKFLENYGFEVIVLDEKEENSNTNVSKAKNYFTSKSNTYLFKLTATDTTDTITDLIKNGAQLVEVPTMYTLTEEQRNEGVDYLSLLNDLIDDIKSEVY